MRIQGYCPMGCGETLFRAPGGHVTCGYIPCPRPTAADEILGDRETEHVVTLNEYDFNLQHPLRERLDHALLDCTLHAELASSDGPPAALGRYRVTTDGTGRRHWTALPGETL